MLYDSHCHLNHPDFQSDWQDIIADCLDKQIGLFIVGDNFESSRQAVEMAENYPDEPVYAALGIHPDELKNESFDEQEYQLLLTDKVKAVGEIGLDYWQHEDTKTLKHKNKAELKERQKSGFIQQLDFAKKIDLPVILHARGSKENPQDAYEDMLDIIKNNFVIPGLTYRRQLFADRESSPNIKGVIHCFGSTKDIAQRFVDLGFLVGFTGIVTFTNKSADPLREVVKSLPLDKILLETDSPFLSPEPHRGERCLPQYVQYVADKVAEIKEVSLEEVKKQTTKNFEKLFLDK